MNNEKFDAAMRQRAAKESFTLKEHAAKRFELAVRLQGVPRPRRAAVPRWLLAAACLCLAVLVGVQLVHSSTQQQDVVTTTPAASTDVVREAPMSELTEYGCGFDENGNFVLRWAARPAVNSENLWVFYRFTGMEGAAEDFGSPICESLSSSLTNALESMMLNHAWRFDKVPEQVTVTMEEWQVTLKAEASVQLANVKQDANMDAMQRLLDSGEAQLVHYGATTKTYTQAQRVKTPYFHGEGTTTGETKLGNVTVSPVTFRHAGALVSMSFTLANQGDTAAEVAWSYAGTGTAAEHSGDASSGSVSVASGKTEQVDMRYYCTLSPNLAYPVRVTVQSGEETATISAWLYPQKTDDQQALASLSLGEDITCTLLEVQTDSVDGYAAATLRVTAPDNAALLNYLDRVSGGVWGNKIIKARQGEMQVGKVLHGLISNGAIDFYWIAEKTADWPENGLPEQLVFHVLDRKGMDQELMVP